jgi:hypothetical protein
VESAVPFEHEAGWRAPLRCGPGDELGSELPLVG